MNKCGKCHLCCEYLLVPLSEIPDDAAEFFRTWGVVVGKSGDGAILKIYSPCQHFSGVGCAIYKKRPIYCREYECENRNVLAGKRSQAV